MLRGSSLGMLREHAADALPMSPAESSVELTQTYQSLRRPLLAYLRRLVGDTQSAEDVLQDVLVKAIASLRSDAAQPGGLVVPCRAQRRDGSPSRTPPVRVAGRGAC
jgi:hypothetical protein